MVHMFDLNYAIETGNVTNLDDQRGTLYQVCKNNNEIIYYTVL